MGNNSLQGGTGLEKHSDAHWCSEPRIAGAGVSCALLYLLPKLTEAGICFPWGPGVEVTEVVVGWVPAACQSLMWNAAAGCRACTFRWSPRDAVTLCVALWWVHVVSSKGLSFILVMQDISLQLNEITTHWQWFFKALFFYGFICKVTILISAAFLKPCPFLSLWGMEKECVHFIISKLGPKLDTY